MHIPREVAERIKALGQNPKLQTSTIAYLCDVSWETANRWRGGGKADSTICCYPDHSTPYAYARKLLDLRRADVAKAMDMDKEKLGRIERGEQDAHAADLRKIVRYYQQIAPQLDADDLLGLTDIRRHGIF